MIVQYQVAVHRYKGQKLAYPPRRIESDAIIPDRVGYDDSVFPAMDYRYFTTESEANRFYRLTNKNQEVAP